MTALGFEAHDHSGCIDDALERAESRCHDAKLQFTPARRRVYEILLQGHQAMGAYDILEILGKGGHSVQPPTVYRALDFLLRAGLIHRIERLNAYAACMLLADHDAGDASHVPAFLICRQCRTVAEAEGDRSTDGLTDAAAASGFVVETRVVEAEGLCPACSEGGDRP
ncbi:Fur family transcriptional regulator [Chachezhania antarctica]|uniref:Fur family transcriptional regulator n=1 Tax=Chachezhania antarctica TaxID=2340860 RepID=UPI000EB1BBBC|nr:transcriptional repressor [Chachezhania antarctica]